MKNLKVKIKKLHHDAVVPSYAHDDDACFDLTAVSREVDENENIVYGTGLAFEIPKGYYMQLQPRSSNTKKDMVLLNSPGIVDSNYRGEVMLKYRKTDRHTTRFYGVGDRIGQAVILPYPKVEFEEVEELSETDRGVGGYGSTGK